MTETIHSEVHDEYLKPPSQLFIEKKPRELSSTRPLKKLNKNLSKSSLHFISSFLKLLIPHKMRLIIISFELLEQGLKLSLVQILVDFSIEKRLHLIKISGVEPRSEKRLLNRSLVGVLRRLRRRLRGSCRHFNGGEFGVREWNCSRSRASEFESSTAELWNGLDESHLGGGSHGWRKLCLEELQWRMKKTQIMSFKRSDFINMKIVM